MTAENLGKAIELLRAEMALIAQGQERLYRLIALVVEDQNKLLDIYRRAPVLRGVATGREIVN